MLPKFIKRFLIFNFECDIIINYEKEEYNPPRQTVKHVQSILQMMSVFTNDKRFEEVYNNHVVSGRSVRNMCEVLDIIEEKGVKKGHGKRQRGRQSRRKRRFSQKTSGNGYV